ncbi:hypothetical protein M0804_002888 [Polistes exclamans]|nr:hypothetical protein M0804_002888 [Polistes exclamans]
MKPVPGELIESYLRCGLVAIPGRLDCYPKFTPTHCNRSTWCTSD